MVDHVKPPEGPIPFADKIFASWQVEELPAPPDLAKFLLAAIADSSVVVPSDFHIELHLQSEHFPTASFMVRLHEQGHLLVLTPIGALRQPS